jgi:hypothetical protein
MNTYLGAAQNLTPADIDAQQIAAARWIYLEGYLWDPPHAKDAFRMAAEIAHGAGRKVALTLSDAFCVDRYRDEFRALMRFRRGRSHLRQRGRAEKPLPDRRLRYRRDCAARRGEACRGDAQRERLHRGLA